VGPPPKLVLDAQEWLSEQLGALIEQIEFVDIEPALWPDSCLGFGRPDESCAQVTTPGWRVIFKIEEQEYEIRTNETGSIVRLEDGQTAFDLLEALRAAVPNIEVADKTPQSPQPLFSVPGRRYQVGDDELQVYEYADGAAAQVDAQRISPDGFTIGATTVDWVNTPHFFQRDRYLVLYLGNNPVMLSLLEGLLGPQIAGGPTGSLAEPTTPGGEENSL
jgi:hypothetical protein